jgi:hypothetical protein
MQAFLAASAQVDFDAPAIQDLARELRAATPAATAKRCFDWVRDRIEHSIDFQREEVPQTASEVLAVGTGFCTSKSNLLVALLRANGIPAGFCYQRLTLDGPHAPYCLHGFVALWLDECGWYRCDARGNKPGICCEFTPGREALAFPVHYEGECLYPGVWAEPWPELVAAMAQLGRASRYAEAPIDLPAPSPAPGCYIEPLWN